MNMKDVQGFLGKQIVELADSELTGEDLNRVLARARATAQVADVYIESVKTELFAIRLFSDTGLLPAAVDTPKQERIGFDGKPK